MRSPRLELLAGEQEFVRRGTGLMRRVPEGVVIVGVGDVPVLVRERPHRAVPVASDDPGTRLNPPRPVSMFE